MKAKTCRSCQTRPIAGGTVRGSGDTDRATAKSVELCLPCLAEAGWENTHSDYGHDVNGPESSEAGEDEAGKRVDVCWMCHPELNEASADYVPRNGTSRQGMEITVPIRATAKDKARVAAEKLGAGDAKIRTNFGTTTLKSKAMDLELRWDANSRFVGGTVGAKKVRNVSEAIRVTR